MKKVITGLLVLLCISALTGCGKDDVTLTSDYGNSTYEGKNTLNNLIPITKFIDVEGLFELLDKYSDKLEKGGFGIKKRVEASAVKNLPKLINTNEVPEGLDIKKILLNVFTKRSYDALGEFSKDAMLISCMHFMDPFNFDEDRVKKCIIHYATPDGRIIPFCTMNSMYRESVEEEFSTPLKEDKN